MCVADNRPWLKPVICASTEGASYCTCHDRVRNMVYGCMLIHRDHSMCVCVYTHTCIHVYIHTLFV